MINNVILQNICIKQKTNDLTSDLLLFPIDYKLLKRVEKIIIIQHDTLDKLDVLQDTLPTIKDKLKPNEASDDEDYGMEMDEIFPLKTQSELDDIEERLKNKKEQKKMVNMITQKYT